MAKKTIFHVHDSTLLDSLEDHEDTFSVLPFALGAVENLTVLEESERVTKFKKDCFYVQLIQGIDWLVGEHHVDVLNLSLGLKRGVFEENEPIHIATKIASDAKTIVVTAAGNRGPKNDTLQAIARAPWVISVGATDKNKKLLERSARGVPDSIGPTLVTNGESDYVELDPRKPQFLPSTSFACARVSRILAFVKVMVRHLTAYIEAASKGNLGAMSPPVYFLKIGYADTGAPRNIEDYLHPMAKSFIEEGENKFCVAHCKDTIHCVNEILSFLIERQQTIELIVEPKTIRSFLVSMCMKMENFRKHEVGAGYLDEQIAIDYWSRFSPQKLLILQFPNLKNAIEEFFTEEKYFFEEEHVQFLFDITTRGPTAHAKVVS